MRAAGLHEQETVTRAERERQKVLKHIDRGMADTSNDRDFSTLLFKNRKTEPTVPDELIPKMENIKVSEEVPEFEAEMARSEIRSLHAQSVRSMPRVPDAPPPARERPGVNIDDIFNRIKLDEGKTFSPKTENEGQISDINLDHWKDTDMGVSRPPARPNGSSRELADLAPTPSARPKTDSEKQRQNQSQKQNQPKGNKDIEFFINKDIDLFKQNFKEIKRYKCRCKRAGFKA